MLSMLRGWRHGWRTRAASLAAITLFCLCLALPGAVSAEGPLEVLQVGWDGNVVTGSWSPVRVRVTGADADANAQVEVILKGRQDFGPQATPVVFPIASYGQEVALPSGVTKEVTIWVPADSNTPGAVRLSVAGRVLAESTLEFRGSRTPFWPLIGVLSESPNVSRKIAAVELPFQGLPIPLDAARLAADDIPVAADRLDALSALVVQGNAAPTLTGEQRQAIRDWVVAGGHLTIAGGPDAPRAAAVLPPGVLPVTFTTTDPTADLAEIAEWSRVEPAALSAGPAARFQSNAGAVLVGTPDHPLVWRMGLGDGTITVLAVDPALQPLADWPGTPALLRKALEPALPNANENEKTAYMSMQREQSRYLEGEVEALPPEAFPDWRTVVAILGGFALVAGPLMHIVLWRVDRRGWSWFAVPGVAVVLAGSLYYVGVGREGRDILANVVTHVRLDPETGSANQAVVTGFFAPTRSNLVVHVPGDLTVRASSRFDNLAFAPGAIAPAFSEPPFRVISGRDTRVEFGSGQWAMRTMGFSRTLGTEVGAITAQLGIEEGLIRGTVRNDTPYLLEDAAVIVGQSLTRLGNLAPGQTAQVVLDPVPPAFQSMYGYQPLSLRLFGRPVEDGSATTARGGMAASVSARPVMSSGPLPGYAVQALPPGGWEQLAIPRDPEIVRRARLLDVGLGSYNQPFYGMGDQAKMPLTFIAFSRNSMGAGLPNAGNHPTFSLTLLEQPLRLDLAPGPFTLPAALIPSEMVAQAPRGGGSGSNGVVSWVELHDGSMTYSFRPPLPQGARTEALIVTTQQFGQSIPLNPGGTSSPIGPDTIAQPAEEGVFAIYNWATGVWEPLPGSAAQARLAPGAPYVAIDGQIRIRVTAPTDQIVRFVVPELTIEGVME